MTNQTERANELWGKVRANSLSLQSLVAWRNRLEKKFGAYLCWECQRFSPKPSVVCAECAAKKDIAREIEGDKYYDCL